MNSTPYIKADACGNDFLLIEGSYAPAGDAAVAEFTRKICDRNSGVGSDGVEWLYPELPGSDADVRIRLFNADGSKAEISGNGTRCVAAQWIAEHGGELVRVRTDAGIKECRLVHAAPPVYEFEIRMGKPTIEGQVSLEVAGRVWDCVLLNMGNPQCAVFVDSFPDGWQNIAAVMQSLARFPQGVNIDFVKVMSPDAIECRFFERGAGETLSSGTGSSASAVASIHTGRVKSPVAVHAPGGAQTVRWEDEIYLTGPAQIVEKGEYKD